MINEINKRGRPTGYRLSDDSKDAISKAKSGQLHKQETKDQISKSLITYFRKKNPISVEMARRYNKVGDGEMRTWISDFSDELDAVTNIMTEKTVRNKCKIEITCGHNIEYFSHNVTPELILIFKEHCEEDDLAPEDIIEESY